MSVFKAFENVYHGRACVIMATGPSLKQYRDPEPDIVKIGVNSAIFAGHDLDFLFIQDPGHPSNPYSYVAKQANYDCYRCKVAKFYGVSLSPMLRDNTARAEAYGYEFTNAPLVEIDGYRIEDPEVKPFFSSNLDEVPPAAAGSIVFPALQFALYAGFSRIYIAGVDIMDPRRFNESEPNGNNYARFHLPRWAQFAQWVSQAYDVRIVSVNPVGLTGMFEDLEQKLEKPTYRMHFYCPPNTIIGGGMPHCAFTSKVERLAPRLAAQGHKIYVYAHARSKVESCELVPVMDDKTLARAYGQKYIHGGWRTQIPKCEIGDPCHRAYNSNMIREMQTRFEYRDFLLSWFGHAAAGVAKAYENAITVEPSVGYFRCFAPFRVYESYHIRSFVQGIENSRVKMYDTVIRPGFDPNEWDCRDQHDGYWLFLGRLDQFKGASTAIKACKRTGERLVVAGQGRIEDVWKGPLPPNVEFVGYADAEMRRHLYAGAKGFLAPSNFQEPAGWTVIEAQLSGVPVVCNDVGGMAESVLHGITGWRCQTMYDYTTAIRRIDEIDRRTCRRWAEQNFNINDVVKKYEEWFGKVNGVFWGNDYYGENESATDLQIQRMIYPKRRGVASP